MVRSNKREPRLSSATYTQSLVKQQLASSSTTTMTTTTTDGSGGGGKTQTQTQTHKKQVRRRLHTSRPYQERLLNMAEARREIVTALKQHRASMRQAARNNIPPPHPPPPPPQPLNLFSPPQPLPPDPFSWTNPSLNFLLPVQPLGLNLNFQDFNDFFQTSSSSSSSSSSTTSSSSSVFPTNPHIYSSPSPPPTATTSDSAPQVPPSSSAGENNVVTSAWWSELVMNTVEPDIKPETEEVVVVENDVFPKLSDVMGFPSWLQHQTEEELFHPYNLTDHYSSPQNPPLSCMEIGEIEGMDEEDWLA